MILTWILAFSFQKHSSETHLVEFTLLVSYDFFWGFCTFLPLSSCLLFLAWLPPLISATKSRLKLKAPLAYDIPSCLTKASSSLFGPSSLPALRFNFCLHCCFCLLHSGNVFLALPFFPNIHVVMSSLFMSACFPDEPWLNCITAKITASSANFVPRLCFCLETLKHTKLFKVLLCFWEFNSDCLLRSSLGDFSLNI